MFKIDNQSVEQLQLIDEALGEIYTKGDNSFTITQCRRALQAIVQSIKEQPIVEDIKENKE